jgi:hypothetical protein
MKMTDHGKRGKPGVFPPFPQSLDPAWRAPHFHNAYNMLSMNYQKKIKRLIRFAHTNKNYKEIISMKILIRPLQDGFSSLYLSCYNGWTNSPESLDELIGIRNLTMSHSLYLTVGGVISPIFGG